MKTFHKTFPKRSKLGLSVSVCDFFTATAASCTIAEAMPSGLPAYLQSVECEEQILVGTPGTAHLVDAYSGASILMANNWQPFVNGLCAAGGLVLSTECCSCLMHSWHREQPQPHSRCQGPECINCLTCSADGVHCFGGGGSGKLYLWEVPTGRLLVVWNGHFKPVTALAFALKIGWWGIRAAGSCSLRWAFGFISLLPKHLILSYLIAKLCLCQDLIPG